MTEAKIDRAERNRRRREARGEAPIAEGDGEVTAYMVRRNVVFSPALPVIYIQNPKAGCTTLKDTLAKALAHKGLKGEKGKLQRIVDLADADAAKSLFDKPAFTMVRNPFSRVLSAYLSKIAITEARPGMAAWTTFARRFELDPASEPTFAEFLRLVAKDDRRDRHWELQTVNLLQPAARIDHVFHIEDTSPISAWLEHTVGIGLETSEVGRRGASSKIERYYDGECVDLVREIYAADFQALGYSLDPANGDAERPPGAFPGIPEALATIAAGALQRRKARLARRA